MKLAHKHSVYDTDPHFQIDGITRAVKNVSATKTMLVQHDHNSERFTFEVPRYIDGHDMSICDSTQIHFTNTSTNKAQKYDGMYIVEDLQVSPDGDDVVIFSWLISNKVTQYVGNVSFTIRFACTDDDGSVVYVWNTAKHSNIQVVESIYNGEPVEDDRNAVQLDLSNFDNGSFDVEWEDGTKSDFTVTFDDQNRPIEINDGATAFRIDWGDA